MTLSTTRRLPILGALAAGLVLGATGTLGGQALVAAPSDTRHLAPGEQITVIADYPSPSPSLVVSPPAPTPSPTVAPTPTPTAPPPTPTPLACGTSLQTIVNAAPVGGVVTLGSCTYRESLTVSKALTIRGPATLDGGGTLKYGIVVTGSPVTIDGLTVTRYANPAQDGAIRIWNVSGTTIKNVHSIHNAGACISLNNTSNDVVADSEFAFCAQEGYHGTAMTNVQFLRNSIHDNNPTKAYDPFWEAGGGKTTRTRQVLFEGNESFNNQGPGLWCDIDCQTTTYRNNKVHDNSLAGIFYEISSTGTIEGNAVWRNGLTNSQGWGWPAGILVSSSRTTEVRGNTASCNQVGISVISQSRSDKPGNPTGLYVHDNLVVTDGKSFALAWLQDWAGTLYSDATNRGSGGRYWSSAPEPQSSRFEYNGGRSTLSAFNATPGEEGGTYVTAAARDAALSLAGAPACP